MSSISHTHDVDTIKSLARGQWAHILPAVAPALAAAVARGTTGGPCPMCGGTDRFAMLRDWEDTGAAICRGCGPADRGGVWTDGFGLLMAATGRPFGEVLRGVAEHVGADGNQTRPASRPAPVEPEIDERARVALNTMHAELISDDGTVQTYLRGRGLTGNVPPPIQYHPALAYWHEGTQIGTYPAMVATVTGPDGRPVTYHRTYLAPGARGKADVPAPKKLMPPVRPGGTRGAAIRLAEAAGDTLAVAEGIETALAVTEATGLPTWATISAGGMAAVEVPEHVRTVHIWADHDPDTDTRRGAGQEAADALAARLHADGRTVYVHLPDEAGTDWLDVFVAAGADALRARLDAAEAWTPPAAEGDQAKHVRPTIQVNDRFLRDITSDAVRALAAANDPPIHFVRGTEIVRVAEDSANAEVHTAASMKGELDRVADFIRRDVKEIDGFPQEIITPRRPPADLAPDILSRPTSEIPLPRLRSISTVPLFLPNGRLLATEGYDPNSGILLRLGKLGNLRTDMQPDEALHWLFGEVFVDFPFADEASKAHTLTMTLQPFVRAMINGATPITGIDAPAQGTGKGLLADVVAYIVTGKPAPVMSLPTDDDEAEKRITAMLLSVYQFILLDNVTRLDGNSINAVLTSQTWRGRRLGRSEMVEVPNDATWAFTGNNVELSNETARRTIPIRLDAGMERPETRTGFRHADLPAFIRKNRNEIVSACLSLVQRWIDAGMPAGKQTLGRYEAWARVMGGILDVAGVSGFLRGRERLYDSADSQTGDWADLLHVWHETFGAEAVTASHLFPLAKEHNLILDVWAGRNHLAAVQRIGHALRARRDRVFGNYQIRHVGPHGITRNAAYVVVKISDPAKNTRNTRYTRQTPESAMQSGFREAAAAGVLDDSGEKHPAKHPKTSKTPGPEDQNTRSGNPLQDGVSEDGTGVPGVSGVFSRPQEVREHCKEWEAF